MWVSRWRTVIGFHASGAAGRCLANRVVEGDLAVLDQEQDEGGGELFADRPGLVDRLRLGGDVVFEVRQAVPGFLDDLTTADDGDAQAGNLLPLALGLDEVIDFVGTNGPGEQEAEDRGQERTQRRLREQGTGGSAAVTTHSTDRHDRHT